jgi:ABC-type transporter Mla MlaB component
VSTPADPGPGDPERRILELAGELTVQTAAETLPDVLAALDGSTALRIDTAGVVELDTAGLQLLLLARREAAARGIELSWGPTAPVVDEVLAIVGLTGVPAGAGRETR